MSHYAKLTTRLLAAWFVLSLTAAAFHLYSNAPGQPPLRLALGVLTPVVIFLVWYASSTQFREFVLSLNPRVLTLVHTWRVEGFTFLVLAAHGVLPKMFALPAGWGDMVIGATAFLVAARLANPEHRRTFILWQVLGIADLVNAVALGTLSGFVNPHGIPTSPMTELPLSMIPTFGVPLFLILHLISIAQARRWPAQQDARLADPAVA